VDNKEYLDIVVFVVNGKTGAKRPMSIGYAYAKDNGEMAFQITNMPTTGTDYSGVIQKRRERPTRQEQNDDGVGF